MLEMLAVKNFFFKKIFLFNVLMSFVVVCFYNFIGSVLFSRLLHLLIRAEQGLPECGLPPRLVYRLLLFYLKVIRLVFERSF